MNGILKRYKAHLGISLLVLMSFIISGFRFDLESAPSWGLPFYAATQVFSLVGFLIIAHHTLTRLTKGVLHPLALNAVTILVGTIVAFFFDFGLVAFYKSITPEFIFKEDKAPLYFQFLEELKYPLVFWPICETAHLYLEKLTRVIYLEKDEQRIEDPFKTISFLKKIPQSQRKELMAIEAQQNYIKLVFPDNDHLVLFRFKEALDELPAIGMQVHRSFWVRHDAIEALENNTLILKNRKEIPVSRTYLREVKGFLGL